MQEDGSAMRAAVLADLERVAVAGELPGLSGHGRGERRFDRRADWRLEVDPLVAASIAQERGDLLIVLDRRTGQAKLELLPAGLVEARKAGRRILPAVSAE